MCDQPLARRRTNQDGTILGDANSQRSPLAWALVLIIAAAHANIFLLVMSQTFPRSLDNFVDSLVNASALVVRFAVAVVGFEVRFLFLAYLARDLPSLDGSDMFGVAYAQVQSSLSRHAGNVAIDPFIMLIGLRRTSQQASKRVDHSERQSRVTLSRLF